MCNFACHRQQRLTWLAVYVKWMHRGISSNAPLTRLKSFTLWIEFLAYNCIKHSNTAPGFTFWSWILSTPYLAFATLKQTYAMASSRKANEKPNLWVKPTACFQHITNAGYSSPRVHWFTHGTPTNVTNDWWFCRATQPSIPAKWVFAPHNEIAMRYLIETDFDAKSAASGNQLTPSPPTNRDLSRDK